MNHYLTDIADDLRRLDIVINQLTQDRRAVDHVALEDLATALAGTVLHLQHLYNGLEKIAERSLAVRGIKLVADGSYHTRLLREYYANYPCDKQEVDFLEDLKSFRHLFRATYGTSLDETRIVVKTEQAIAIWPRIKERITRQMNLEQSPPSTA
ncbi:MAG: hypothetical protein LBK60_04935 [Verrucomicrobiales bacterium]|jgi:hypothetical protein|nr:hypothetical protein [Verrucomicrobiales bacterium]